MTKLTTKIANILLTLLILSAICIAPIAASPAKLTTDSSVKEVANELDLDKIQFNEDL